MLSSLIIMTVISSIMVISFELLLFKGILEDFKFKREKIYYSFLIISFLIALVLQILTIVSCLTDKTIGFPIWVSFLPLILFIAIPCVVLLIVMIGVMKLNDEELKEFRYLS